MRKSWRSSLPHDRWLGLSLRHIAAIKQVAKVKALVNMVVKINTTGLSEGLCLPLTFPS